jgi:collagenase-like PrtC family protease
MEVHEWTITSPLLITLLHELFPNDFIEVSTIAEVSTPTDAQRWKDLGAGGVNVSTNINRCFPLLHDINRVLKASVLANEACLYRCPYRRDCYNLSSHDSWRGRKFFDWYPFRWCNEQRIRNPEEWLKSRMVMPQWMRIYQKRAGIEWFKIAYRTHPESVAVPILEAYMSQNFTGNYCAMWPTIARLGDTSEPTKTTYISAKALDDTGFLDWWDSEEDECSGTRCGLECVYCHTAYDKAKEAGQ